MTFLRQVYWDFMALSAAERAHLYIVTILLLSGFVIAARMRRRWRLLALVVLAVLSIRFAMFGNPIAWERYAGFFQTADMGWREWDVMFDELRVRTNWGKPLDAPRYLAVGSSQVRAIFGQARQLSDPKLLQFFSLAGMSILDLDLYRDRIAAFHPRHVVLYLSEFDMAHDPALELVRFAPAEFFDWPGPMARLVVGAMATRETRHAALEWLLAQLFPEYEYSFIPRGLVDRALGKRALLAIPGTEQMPDSFYLAQHLNTLSELTAEVIPVNLARLSDFLAFCTRSGIDVIIVEGQYNPLGVTPGNAVLHAQVVAALRSVAADHHATFVPRTRIREFTESDYRDGFHVRPGAGRRFADRFFEVLDPDHDRP